MTTRVGQRIPDVTLARAEGDAVAAVNLQTLIQGKKVILVGLPGAFTPVCTTEHLPLLVRMAPQLKASGIDEIICVAPNSPWVVAEWAKKADPQGRMIFLSDGNMELTRKAGMATRAPQYFLGECSKRYTMVVDRCVISRLAVEDQLETISCTDPRSLSL